MIKILAQPTAYLLSLSVHNILMLLLLSSSSFHHSTSFIRCETSQLVLCKISSGDFNTLEADEILKKTVDGNLPNF